MAPSVAHLLCSPLLTFSVALASSIHALRVLLEEQGIAIRRPEAKKIQSLPEWKGLHPVIQASGDRFLDIRLLRLYKANHISSSSPKCNAYVTQRGPARLTMIARRDIWQEEEILWEYSPTLSYAMGYPTI